MIGNPMGNVLGNPLGNPLSLSASPTARPINPRTIYIPGSRTVLTEGVFIIPDATFARVTAIGGGGSAVTERGGAGGGLSRSPVLPVQTGEQVIYSIPAGSMAASDGATATATFKNYVLVATGGEKGNSSTQVRSKGGIGSGGEVNNAGGTGGGALSGYGGGGGCAGISGPGGDGADGRGQATAYSGDGGGGGATQDAGGFGGGGGGFGQPGGDAIVPISTSRQWYALQTYTDRPTKGFSSSAGGDGGRFGGGGGSGFGLGGVGGFIIELW